MYDCLILLSYSANYCFVCNSLTLLFSFCLFYFSFSSRYFFGFINPSLSIQIGVGFPAAFVVNFLLACYNWLLNIFSSCFWISWRTLSFGLLGNQPSTPLLVSRAHCKRRLLNFNASLHSFSLSGFCLVSLPVVINSPPLWLLLYLLIQKFSSGRWFASSIIICNVSYSPVL